MKQNTIMIRKEIRKIFADNRGAAAQLARDLNLTQATISLWLSGKVKSQRIANAASDRAHQLDVARTSKAA